MNHRNIWVAFSVLAVLLLPSFVGVADSSFLPPESGMVVDIHWIDIIQEDNLRSFEISETLFFNNTGNDPFNGTIYMWIPRGAAIKASCCGGAPDMACRLVEDGSMSCYTVWQIEENIASIVPFSTSQLLSFYGQTASLNLSVRSQTNSSNADYLQMTIEVGGASVVSEVKNTSAPKIHLISENSTYGAVQRFDTIYPPLNYDFVQKLEIFNNGNETDTFDLDVDGIPEGWQVSFASNGTNITSISVQPSERLEIDLVMEVPSHLASILIGYEVDLGSTGNEKVTTSFEKRFLYESDTVEIYVFLLEGSALEEGSNVTIVHPPSGQEPIWNEPNRRYWYIVTSRELAAGALADLKISWVVKTDLIPYVIIAAFAGLMILLVALPILRKRRMRSKGTDDAHTDESEDEPGIEVGTSPRDVRGLERAVERVERDCLRGLISKDQATLLISKLRERATTKPDLGNESEDRASPSEGEASERLELSEYVTQLGILKQIVRELDTQHQDGRLPDEIYQELKEDYGARIEDVRTKMESSFAANPKRTELIRKKRKISEAMEKLRMDFESGTLPEDVYIELKRSYERKMADLDRSIMDGGGSD